MKEFNSLKDFYPYYLGEHQNRTCRQLHFVGTSLVITIAFMILLMGLWKWLWVVPLYGYGFAWVGHFFFEKNKPATFKYPLYSFLSDFIMFKDIILGKIPTW